MTCRAAAVRSVLRVLTSTHHDVAADVVEAVVRQAAGELAGAPAADFPRLLHLRSSARLSAMAGSPVVVGGSGRWAPAW